MRGIGKGLDRIVAALAVIVVLLLSGCVQQGSQPEMPGGSSDTYTLAEVSAHGSASDCWLVISGKVYDVTDWIASHPGGNAILEGCGTDATQLFETRPMGSGTPHSNRARNLLPNYFIGDLEG